MDGWMGCSVRVRVEEMGFDALVCGTCVALCTPVFNLVGHGADSGSVLESHDTFTSSIVAPALRTVGVE